MLAGTGIGRRSRAVAAMAVLALVCAFPAALPAETTPAGDSAVAAKKKKKKCKKPKVKQGKRCVAPESPTPATPSPTTPAPPQPQVIVVDATTVPVNEGATAMLQVQLQNQPTATTTVTLGSSDNAIATGNPTSLTFNSGNYNVNQAVTVSGINDNDLTADSATLTLSAPGAPSVPVTVNVTDDDVQQIVTSPANLNTLPLTEGDPPVAIGVRLAFEPAMSVNVTATSNSPAKMTVSPGSNPYFGDYDVDKNFNVSAPEDVDMVDESTTLTLASPGGPIRAITIPVDDNDN